MRVLSALILAAAFVGAQNVTTCHDGLYILVARGTNEDPGTGLFGDIADELADRIPGSEVLGLDYPASLTDPIYIRSVREGGEAMKDAVEGYHEECPDGQIVLLGYSQGAQVSFDALCGGRSEDEVEVISADIIENNVVAMVMFGDPSFVAGASYNAGTTNNDGIFDREDVAACEALGSALVSYCDAGDIYCDGGHDNRRDLSVHGEYFEKYHDEVLDFIVSRYEGNSGSSNTTITRTPVGGGAAAGLAVEMRYLLLPLGFAMWWQLI